MVNGGFRDEPIDAYFKRPPLRGHFFRFNTHTQVTGITPKRNPAQDDSCASGVIANGGQKANG
jgi:hypothetical protein